MSDEGVSRSPDGGERALDMSCADCSGLYVESEGPVGGRGEGGEERGVD